MNERHSLVEKYYCPVEACKRSRVCGNPFPRAENCRRHMMRAHRGSGCDGKGMRGVAVDVDLDEVTRDMRQARKRSRRIEY